MMNIESFLYVVEMRMIVIDMIIIAMGYGGAGDDISCVDGYIAVVSVYTDHVKHVEYGTLALSHYICYCY